MAKNVQHESIWQRWVVRPVKAQLTQGVEPAKIAQAIAFGVATGLFPLLGMTILVSLAVGIPLKLNQPVMQVFRELVYPLHLATILVFMRAGESLFGQPHVPLSLPLITERFFAGPGRFFAEFGMIGLYAVVVWLLIAPVLVIAVFFLTRPLLCRLASRIPVSRDAPS